MLGHAIKKVWYEVVRGGKTYIYDLEAFALGTMLNSLCKQERKRFLLKLKRLDLVQRSPDSKIVALYQAKDNYFRTWEEILLENRQKNFLAYRVRLGGSRCPLKNIVLEVYFHEGRISSIEYKNKVRWPREQERVSIEALDWERVCNDFDFEINKSELFL